MSRASGGQPALGNGTPEQVHLTWGDDPATSVIVSWATPGRAVRPRVRIGQRVILAQERSYSDATTRKTVWSYHAAVAGLRPGAAYGYAVTADNDGTASDPFTSTFRTAPAGRAAFRFTSSGDLSPATLVPLIDSPGPAAYAAGSVESFQPLFHLMNGGLCDGAPGSLKGTAGWRTFGTETQVSAAARPWLPVPGRYAAGSAADRRALAPYLSRYVLPSDGSPGSGGRWYAFRVGTVVFACLDSSDVAYADRSYPNGAQTRWLEQALARARADASVDWVIVSLHHPACCSVPGCDLGVREEWLPLFDTYQVDLVLAGHAGGYERSFPCRGHDLAATRRPRPVSTESGPLDTSQGTVHLAMGHAATGTTAPGTARVDMGNGGEVAIEQATWSARREPATGPGIVVFDVNPGTEADGQTSITVSAYRAGDAGPEGPAGVAAIPADDLTEIERITLVRPRSDHQRRQVRDGAGAGRSR
jgi:hypothetical protein